MRVLPRNLPSQDDLERERKLAEIKARYEKMGKDFEERNRSSRLVDLLTAFKEMDAPQELAYRIVTVCSPLLAPSSPLKARWA